MYCQLFNRLANNTSAILGKNKKKSIALFLPIGYLLDRLSDLQYTLEGWLPVYYHTILMHQQ
jgi:hypothetical protein